MHLTSGSFENGPSDLTEAQGKATYTWLSQVYLNSKTLGTYGWNGSSVIGCSALVQKEVLKLGRLT